MAETVDVAVIGAGVVGCSVAYYLAKMGVSVHLYEREATEQPASEHWMHPAQPIALKDGANLNESECSNAPYPCQPPCRVHKPVLRVG